MESMQGIYKVLRALFDLVFLRVNLRGKSQNSRNLSHSNSRWKSKSHRNSVDLGHGSQWSALRDALYVDRDVEAEQKASRVLAEEQRIVLVPHQVLKLFIIIEFEDANIGEDLRGVRGGRVVDVPHNGHAEVVERRDKRERGMTRDRENLETNT